MDQWLWMAESAPGLLRDMLSDYLEAVEVEGGVVIAVKLASTIGGNRLELRATAKA